MEQQTFTEQVGVRYAVIGKGKRVHYSPSNDDGLCGRAITAYLDVWDAVALFDKGYELCRPCHRAAEKRAEARRLADASPIAAAVIALVETVEQGDAEQAATDGTWRGEWIGAQDDAETLFPIERNTEQGALFTERAAAEQRAVEGVVVEHAGTAEGSTPSNASNPDVVAARAALDGIAVATMTEHHDVTDPAEDEQHVRGYLVDPRTHGRVAVYWLEQGRIVRRDDPWHGPGLDCLADRLRRRGWVVEKMLRSSQCVFAHLPAEGAVPTPQTMAAAGESVPAEPVPGTLVDPWTWLRRPASSHDTRSAATPAVEALTCRHSVTPRADVSGDPIKRCATKESTQEAGVFSDEGCVEAYDCCVQAANRAAELNAEDDAPADEPLYGWDLMCPEHREQQVDTCEECAADDETDAAEAELLAAVDAVEEAERTDGTWRGAWIAAAPNDPALLDLDPTAEQGALFT
ncbi:hypothetical protein [Streptomyces sp. NPDC053048]|uniref:hypothetical protein n=1 Tax=Streptomyces sp. NPDC053048 TaxID=3365694 RepID=UPI0037D296C9